MIIIYIIQVEQKEEKVNNTLALGSDLSFLACVYSLRQTRSYLAGFVFFVHFLRGHELIFDSFTYARIRSLSLLVVLTVA